MGKSVVEVRVRALVPTGSGCAVFIGTEEKVFVIYVDPGVGSAIGMFINGQEKERPLTHDLMALLLEALGAKVQRVVINDLKNGTYFGRLIITIENEIQQKKIIELDARPSDCMAMAAQQRAPIYVCEDVWNEVEDMSEVLEKIEESRENGPSED
ncbi:MAG TPA: bifunctional nuclease family protein [Chthoniobacterales bacterium]|jgi:bifunctional DNase/RNase|nr:bifunctional nuclease family protein [Chthoniobacterales bacterium]